ncbi:MAG TPA: hypothetical protein VI451_16835, partial [Anaerolineales bacterium]|nr:hypothetical protein [Anaerolineales bacterium]
ASAESMEEGEMVPEWLQDTLEESESAIEIPEEVSEDLDWGEEQILATEDEPIEPAISEKLELTALDELGEVTEMPEMAEDEDAAMAWLEGLAVKQGAKEEELLTAPTERQEDIPDWLQGILDEEPEMDEEISTPIQETDLADLLEEEFELAEAEQETPPEFDEALAPTMEESEEAPLAEVPEELEEEVALDEDAALAWLESLAAKQGVKEEELLTAADMRPEDTPDWVKDVAEEARAEEEVTPEPVMEPSDEMDFLTEIVEEQREEETAFPEEEETLEPVQMEEDTDWLAELQEDEEESVPASEEAPEWLTESASGLLAEALSEEIAGQIEEETEPPEEEAAIPDWVLDEEPAVAEELAEEESEGIQEEVEEVPVPVMEIESEPEAAPEILVEVDLSEALSQARTTLFSGDVIAAAEYYENLIKNNQNIDEAISDITEALDTRYPVDIGLWQTLGDAYVRKNSLQDALDAYTKAEELLR